MRSSSAAAFVMAVAFLLAAGCSKKNEGKEEQKAAQTKTTKAAQGSSDDALAKGALDFIAKVKKGDLEAARSHLVTFAQCPALFPKSEDADMLRSCPSGVEQMNRQLEEFAAKLGDFEAATAERRPTPQGSPPTTVIIAVLDGDGKGDIPLSAVQADGRWYYMFPLKREMIMQQSPRTPPPPNDDKPAGKGTPTPAPDKTP